MSKVVLITGGSSGIGKSIGIFLSKKGYSVYGTSRTPEKYIETAEFKLIKLDVCDKNSIKKAIDNIISIENRIDVLINNAGIGITGAMEETPEEEMHKAFDTNVYGPIALIKNVLPQMRKQQSGLIVNITSIAAYMGLPYRGVYSATKGALELLTEAIRMEVKDFNIQLTSIAPGEFATNIAEKRYHAPIHENSPYKISYGKTLEIINEHVNSGDDPIIIAKQIYKLINTKKPKVHYKTGTFLQKFSVVLKHILPDLWYEKLLLNHYKL